MSTHLVIHEPSGKLYMDFSVLTFFSRSHGHFFSNHKLRRIQECTKQNFIETIRNKKNTNIHSLCQTRHGIEISGEK